jgi:hypothetical protein
MMVKFANRTLKAMVMQVCIGLSQAQAYMRLSHNDLHAENVMISIQDITKTRVYRTGFGEFVVPPSIPTAVIIDMQLASCDILDGAGVYRGRMQGYQDSYLNGDGAWYDLYRLSSNLMLDSLRERDVWGRVDGDLRQFLCECTRCPPAHATPDHHPPNLPCESQINAHLAYGIQPRSALNHDVFGEFCPQGPHMSAGDVFWIEEPDDGYDNAATDTRYMTTAMTNWRCGEDVVAGKTTGVRSSLRPELEMLARPLPPIPSPDERAGALVTAAEAVLKQGAASMACDVFGDTLSRITRYGGDSHEKSRYGWMELERFQRSALMFYRIILAVPSWLERPSADALFAVYDACQVCTRQRLDWIGRHEGATNEVRRIIDRPEILEYVTKFHGCTLPCHYISVEHIQQVAETNKFHIYDDLIKASATYSTYSKGPFDAYSTHISTLSSSM